MNELNHKSPLLASFDVPRAFSILKYWLMMLYIGLILYEY